MSVRTNQRGASIIHVIVFCWLVIAAVIAYSDHRETHSHINARLLELERQVKELRIGQQ